MGGPSHPSIAVATTATLRLPQEPHGPTRSLIYDELHVAARGRPAPAPRTRATRWSFLGNALRQQSRFHRGDVGKAGAWLEESLAHHPYLILDLNLFPTRARGKGSRLNAGKFRSPWQLRDRSSGSPHAADRHRSRPPYATALEKRCRSSARPLSAPMHRTELCTVREPAAAKTGSGSDPAAHSCSANTASGRRQRRTFCV